MAERAQLICVLLQLVDHDLFLDLSNQAVKVCFDFYGIKKTARRPHRRRRDRLRSDHFGSHTAHLPVVAQVSLVSLNAPT